MKSILIHKLLIYIIPFLLGLFTSFSLPPYNFLIINFITCNFFFNKSVDHPGKLAMVEQWIGVRALHFEGTQESRFSFAIWEERDRLEKNQGNIFF